ncbi:MAG: S1 family serine peptidase [Terriglobales bacterium]
MVAVLAFTFCIAVIRAADNVEVGSNSLKRVLTAYRAGQLRDGRIAGGHDTTIEGHPWQVAIVATGIPTNNLAQFCGGSIIAPRWVLTAAHCVDGGTRPEQISILAGTASLLSVGRRIGIAPNGIVIHEKWDLVTHEADIALLHAAGDLGGKPISGPKPQSDEQDGHTIVVTGWGAVDWKQNPPRTNALQEVTVKLVSRGLCNQKVSYDGHVSNDMFCAGDYLNGGFDSCSGDSGGPAANSSNPDARLVGIVSWGDEHCGAPKKPAVYTRVSQFTTWLRDNTGGDVKW